MTKTWLSVALALLLPACVHTQHPDEPAYSGFGPYGDEYYHDSRYARAANAGFSSGFGYGAYYPWYSLDYFYLGYARGPYPWGYPRAYFGWSPWYRPWYGSFGYPYYLSLYGTPYDAFPYYGYGGWYGSWYPWRAPYRPYYRHDGNGDDRDDHDRFDKYGRYDRYDKSSRYESYGPFERYDKSGRFQKYDRHGSQVGSDRNGSGPPGVKPSAASKPPGTFQQPSGPARSRQTELPRGSYPSKPADRSSFGEAEPRGPRPVRPDAMPKRALPASGFPDSSGSERAERGADRDRD